MKGILVEPPCDISFTTFPPLGLLSLHAACKVRHEIDVQDLSLRHEEVLFQVVNEGHAFIGVACRYTYNADRVKRFIHQIREEYPEKWILAGGQHASFDWEGMLDAGADVVVLHEGEDSLPVLLASLEKDGGPLDRIPGIVCREEDGRVRENALESFVDMDSIPSPSFELMDPLPYFIAKGYYGISIEASRGCVNNCRYCCTTQTWKRTWRGKNPDRVAEEMEEVSGRGFNFIYFSDDNFCRDIDWGHRFLNDLIKKRIQIPYMACLEPTTVIESPDMIPMLERTGCMVVYMSIDSIHDEILADYRRPVRFHQIREAASLLSRSSICLISNVILGNPKESVSQMRLSLKFARKHVDIPTAGSLEARPGNGYWQREMFEQSQELGKGSAFLHPQKRRVNLLLMVHLLGAFLKPQTLVRTFLSRKEGTRFMLRFHYKLYYKAMLRKASLFLRAGRQPRTAGTGER